MKRRTIMLAPMTLLFNAQASAQEAVCPDAPASWQALVEDMYALIDQTQREFGADTLQLSSLWQWTSAKLREEWSTMLTRWLDITIPQGREIFHFTAVRVCDNVTKTIDAIDGASLDDVQIGRTAESIDSFRLVETFAFPKYYPACEE